MQTRTVVKFSLQANIRRRRRRGAAKQLGFHQLETVGRARQEVEPGGRIVAQAGAKLSKQATRQWEGRTKPANLTFRH